MAASHSADLSKLRIDPAKRESEADSNSSGSKYIFLFGGIVVAAAAIFFLFFRERQAAVASKGTGRLEYLGVEEGDQVKAGQIIARLEHSDISAALAQAQAELAAAKARLPQSQADRQEATIQYERYKQLVAEQLVPRGF
jgi:multidrug efflux pump subunit AcrA (membrane-fusion protein)